MLAACGLAAWTAWVVELTIRRRARPLVFTTPEPVLTDTPQCAPPAPGSC
jgi:hypothetical protein